MRGFWVRAGRVLVLLAVAAVVALAPAAFAQDPAGQPDKVLVAGDPALTETVVSRFNGFIEWVLEAPLTEAQRQHLRDGLIEAWQAGDKETIAQVVDILDAAAVVAGVDAAQRDVVRAQMQPEVLAQLRQQPDDEASRWLLGIYDSAHQPIAEGTPPLTRQITDAYAEVLCFMSGQVLGDEVAASAEIKEVFAQSLIADYPKCDAAARADLARMPLYWAAIRVTWPTLAPEEQETYRSRWAEGLRKLAGTPAPAAPPIAGGARLEGETAAAYAHRAAQYLRNAVYDEAIADCNRAIALDPKCAVAYATRGEAYSNWKHDAPRCIADCTRAIELDPKCWIAYQYRGVALCTEGDSKGGDADWAKMREIKRALGLEAPAQAGGKTAADLMREYDRHQQTLKWAGDMGRMSHETNMAIIHNIGDGWRYEYRY